jgi:hypothetical protein
MFCRPLFPSDNNSFVGLGERQAISYTLISRASNVTKPLFKISGISESFSKNQFDLSNIVSSANYM